MNLLCYWTWRAGYLGCFLAFSLKGLWVVGGGWVVEPSGGNGFPRRWFFTRPLLPALAINGDFLFCPPTPQNNTFHKKKVVLNPTPAMPRCRITSPSIRISFLSNKNSPVIKILQLIRIPTDKLIPMQLEEWMVETIIIDDVSDDN